WALEFPCVAAVRRLDSARAQFWGTPLPQRYRSPVSSRSASGETAAAAGCAGVLALGTRVRDEACFVSRGFSGTFGGGVASAFSVFSAGAAFSVAAAGGPSFGVPAFAEAPGFWPGVVTSVDLPVESGC